MKNALNAEGLKKIKIVLIAMSVRRITRKGITQIKGMEINKMKKYSIEEIFTMSEAAERYGINIDTIKSRVRTSSARPERFNSWLELGIIRKSGKTWLLTDDFMKQFE
ncbi:MAG TPA: helix-turn-helix domain-containing protein [Metalysinibacillus sp.]